MKNERILYIDYLKVMGLLLVILAHVDCPKIIMQLRNFDVPLLVVLSGYLAAKTYQSGNEVAYYYKRIQRLAIPAWIFLIIFFIVQSIAYRRPSILEVFKAVTFQRDANMVGMLWIIWVYLICAFLIPIIYKVGYSRKVSILLVLIFLIYEIICTITTLSDNRLIYITVITIIPWGGVTYLGFYLDQISQKQRKIIIFISLIIFIICASILKWRTGEFVLTSDYKYPAQLYYLSFAIPIIITLMEVFSRLYLKKNKVINFISSSSLWIYLWHILILYIVKSIIINDELWFLQYIAIICISILITWIQNLIIKFLMQKYNLDFLKVFLG